MSNASQTQNRRTGSSLSPTPRMTTAARQALADQRNGIGHLKPFAMPEVAVGEIVMYQDGFYRKNQQGTPAIVTEVTPNAVELSVFTREAQNIRILGGAVRHKDDPEVARLAQVNSAGDEPEGFGVWYREPWMLTPTETKRMKLLMDLYATELDEFQKSGTINGNKVEGGETTGE